MPRLNNASELFKFLNSVEVFRLATAATPGDTTTTAALARSAASIPVAAITNFTAGDPFFIVGDGGTEVNTVSSAAALAIVPTLPVGIVQSSGARVVEAVSSPLGHVTEDGVTFGGTQSRTAINAATARVALAYFAGPAEMSWSFTLLGHNNQNLLMSFGATETETGTGTAADPHTGVIDLLAPGSQGLQCIRFKGIRNDGKNVWVDVLDAVVEVSASVKLGGATPSGMALGGRATGIIQRVFT